MISRPVYETDDRDISPRKRDVSVLEREYIFNNMKVREVKLFLLQTVEAFRIVRSRGPHIV
jgi:hypothetical protein